MSRRSEKWNKLVSRIVMRERNGKTPYKTDTEELVWTMLVKSRDLEKEIEDVDYFINEKGE